MKKKVAVASKNPVKINAVEKSFKLLFPEWQIETEAFSVPSGVADQPFSDQETYSGALNRINNLSSISNADYLVAIEGGIEEKNGEHEVFAWVIVKSKEGKIGKGRSSTFILPELVS